MGQVQSPFRLRFALLAAVVLSALSAAEATLAAAPLFDAGGDHGWPAQFTAAKDRDAVNQRTVRAADHSSIDDKFGHDRVSGSGFAIADHDGFCFTDERVTLGDTAFAAAKSHRLGHALLDLPPPVL